MSEISRGQADPFAIRQCQISRVSLQRVALRGENANFRSHELILIPAVRRSAANPAQQNK